MVRTPGLLLVLGFAVAGCSTVGYYAQAVGGQLSILAHAEPIEEILSTPPPSPAPAGIVHLRERLSTVLAIREFASDRLSLPDNGSYRDYVALDREAVAWNVVVTPELSLTPQRWCFPVIGCVPYRGFFSLSGARRFSEEWQESGFDVLVAPVAGYSTLGWFRDPIISTQLTRDDVDLAALIFHELAHQQIYIPNDAAFNESFATVVEKRGVQVWMGERGSPERFARWEQRHRMQQDFVQLLGTYRDRLQSLYQSSLPPEQQRERKRELFSDLRRAYPGWRKQWNNDSRYDHWFKSDLNNAHLAGVDLYFRHVPAFEALFRDCENNFSCFYAAARTIGQKSPPERERVLGNLNSRTTATSQKNGPRSDARPDID